MSAPQAAAPDGPDGRPSWWRWDLGGPAGGDLTAAAGLAALVLTLFASLLAGRVLFDRDIGALFHPQAEAFFAAVRAGSWPVWNPFVGFGEPMLANANTQVLYPPTWLLLLVPPATYYSGYVIAHLVWGGLGTYALARALGVGRPAAFVGGAVFVLSGPTLSMVNVWNHLAGACWMSWVVAAAIRALRTCAIHDALTWALVAAVQVFAGSPDMCLLTLAATLAGWGAAHAAGRAGDPRGPKALAAILALAALAGAGLAAAQWLPTLWAARAGSRHALPFAARAFWSVHPLSLAQLVAPLPWAHLPYYSPRAAELFDVWQPFLASLYLGAAAAGLVAAALAGPAARPARRLAVFALLALVVAMGSHTPVYRVLTEVVPPLAMFRFPAKVMALVGWAWGLLAALGADAWQRGPTMSWRRPVLATTALLALGLCAVAFLLRAGSAAAALPLVGPPAPGGAEVVREALVALLVAALAASAMLTAAVLSRPGRRLAAVAAIVTLADLALAHRGLNPTAPAAFFRYRPEILGWLVRDPRPRLFVWDYVTHVLPDEPSMLQRFMDVREGLPAELGRALGLQSYLYPPIAARWGLFGSFDRDLIGLSPPWIGDLAAGVSRLRGTQAYPRLLQVGAVDFVVSLHDEGPAGLVPVARIGTALRVPVQLSAVPAPRPRAFLAGEAVVADGEAAWRVLLDPRWDPARGVVLSEGEPLAPGPFEGRMRVARDDPDRFEAIADLARTGWMVRVTTYDPGWRASVDGRPARLVRADYAFQGVLVPAGHHRIDLVYRPRAVTAGLVVSALAALACGLVWLAATPRAAR